MKQVREVISRNANKPIEVNELLDKVNKLDLGAKIGKDEMKAVLSYYQKL
jgi:hypothetical protein